MLYTASEGPLENSAAPGEHAPRWRATDAQHLSGLFVPRTGICWGTVLFDLPFLAQHGFDLVEEALRSPWSWLPSHRIAPDLMHTVCGGIMP